MSSGQLPRWVPWAAACLVLFAGYYIFVWWSRPPAVTYDNLRYVQLLWTATSSRNSEWLAGVEKAVEQRHAAREMSDQELDHFRQIIARAEGGDWEGASRESYDFAQAQLNRSRSEPPSETHDHNH